MKKYILKLIIVILLSISSHATDLSLEEIKEAYYATLPKLQVESFNSVEKKSEVVVAFLKKFLPEKVKNFKGEEELKNKITRLMHEKKPLAFVLPAYPSKSLNEKYVIGQAPDLGDYLGLLTLHHMVDSLAKICAVTCDIITDGPFYQDVLQQTEKNMTLYLENVKKLLPSKNITLRKIQELPNLSVTGKDDMVSKKIIMESFDDKVTGDLVGLNTFYKEEYNCDFYKSSSIEEVVNFCAIQGPKFSEYLKQAYGGYEDHIRLSINVAKETDVSVKFPIALVVQKRKSLHAMPWMRAPVIFCAKEKLTFKLSKKSDIEMRNKQAVLKYVNELAYYEVRN